MKKSLFERVTCRMLALSFALATLTGCLTPEKFDATNETTIKESAGRISKALPAGKKEDFAKALMYFSLNGKDGMAGLFRAAMSGNTPDSVVSLNIRAIDGLTGDQIIEKQRQSVAEANTVQEVGAAAKSLLKDKRFEEALVKYKALQEVPSGSEAGRNGIVETTKAMEDFTAQMAYMDNVQLKDFTARRIDTYSEKGVPAVRFSLKNVGNRSLDQVKVVVYFQDKSGATIFEEDYHPVLVSTYSFGGNNKPLKAGYTWEMERNQYYTLKSELLNWQEGKAIVKVVEITFSP